MSSSAPSETGGLEQVSANAVTKGFLSKYRFLHEYRMQKLIYIADLVAAVENGARLTNLNFKPYMFGSYADDLSNVLEELKDEVRTKPDTHHGKVTTAFFGSNVNPSLSETAQDIIDRVHVATSSKSNEELAEWSKESWLYENTEYDEVMDFERAVEEAEDEIREDLRRGFPELGLME